MQENTILISRADYDDFKRTQLLYKALLNEDYIEVERIYRCYGYTSTTIVKKSEAISRLKEKITTLEDKIRELESKPEPKPAPNKGSWTIRMLKNLK